MALLSKRLLWALRKTPTNYSLCDALRRLVPRRNRRPAHADRRNFYKVEKWCRDGQRTPSVAGVASGMSGYTLARLTLNRCIFTLVRADSYSPFMGRFRTVYRLGPCLTALRLLAKSDNSNRYLLVERHIDKYLRTHPFSLAHALRQFRPSDPPRRSRRARRVLEHSQRVCWLTAQNDVIPAPFARLSALTNSGANDKLRPRATGA